MTTRAEDASTGRGLGLTVAMHVVAVGGLYLADSHFKRYPEEVFRNWEFLFFFLGVTQLFYMGPIMLIAFLFHRRALLKGLFIGMAMTFILNAACFGVMFLGKALR